MPRLFDDLRFASRSLVKRPGFTMLVGATLAIGIGANSAIFGVVNGVLLEPMPVREPGTLVVPEVISPLGFSISLSIPNFRDWRERNRVFESFGLIMSRDQTLTGIDRPQVIETRLVHGDFFETLGVPAAIGRVIPAAETEAGAAPVAVVTHAFWQQQLGGTADVLGRTLRLNGRTFTVIGVMPEDFVFPSADTRVFLPMGYFAEGLCWDDRGCSQGSYAIGRLRRGVDLTAAQADMDRVVREISAEEGEDQATARLQTLSAAFVGDIERQIWILMGTVAFVLLIACANVAGLLLARGEGRRREIAVRAALGAGRADVVRLLLAEAAILAAVSGALGVLVAHGILRVMVPAIADGIPSALLGRIGIDGPVLLFTLAVTAIATLAFGVLPALRSASPRLGAELREGGRGGSEGVSRQRLRSALVAGEVALSLVLLIGAGLMLQSLGRLQRVDKGFDGRGVFTARVGLPGTRYDSRDKAWRFFEDLRRRVAALPGVASATLTNIVPLQGNSWEMTIYAEGVPIEPENANSVLYYLTTPEYFETLGVEIVRGRPFTDADRDGTLLTAVVDETLAERFWPGEDPIGKRVTFESDDTEDGGEVRVYRTVIGVTRNVRHYELENPSRIQVYVPMAQSHNNWTRSMYLLARTSVPPMTVTEAVRREVAALDPEVPLYRIETMEGYVTDALGGTKVLGGFLTVFAGFALLLSAMGIFGVIAYQVVQRMREIGIRMALGATAGSVMRMVTVQGLAISGVGIGLGLLGAFLMSRVMTSLLYEVSAVDPATYAGLAGLIGGITAVAALVPAAWATRVDPAVVLRAE